MGEDEGVSIDAVRKMYSMPTVELVGGKTSWRHSVVDVLEYRNWEITAPTEEVA